MPFELMSMSVFCPSSAPHVMQSPSRAGSSISLASWSRCFRSMNPTCSTRDLMLSGTFAYASLASASSIGVGSPYSLGFVLDDESVRVMLPDVPVAVADLAHRAAHHDAERLVGVLVE